MSETRPAMGGDDYVSLRSEVEFLLERLDELELDDTPEDFVRDWYGHVAPPLERVRAMLSAAPPSPRSDEGEGKPVAWLIGGENEGRGAFVTMSREVVDVAKARDLLIQPLFAAPPSPTPSGGPMALELQYRLAAPPSPRADDGEPYTVQCTDNGFLGDVLPAAAPPSPTPSGEVGELARLLNAAADAFEREAEDGFEAGERADLWDQVVEVPLKDVRTAASLLLSLDAERGRLREEIGGKNQTIQHLRKIGSPSPTRDETIEMCAKWHDEQAAQYDVKRQEWIERGFILAADKCDDLSDNHRRHAASIRSLKSTPDAEGE